MSPDAAIPVTIGLGIICKAPRPGSSKTRIGAVLGHDMAAALAGAFLRDVVLTVDRLSQSGLVSPVVFYKPPDGAAEIARFATAGMQLVPQSGRAIGSVVVSALRALLSAHPKGALVLAPDVPTLPAETIAAAVGLLLRPGKRIVVGRARNGSLYLAGTNVADGAGLFASVHDGSLSTIEALAIEAKAAGLELVEVAAWQRIETAEDLDHLAGEMVAIPPENAVHTRALLSALI